MNMENEQIKNINQVEEEIRASVEENFKDAREFLESSCNIKFTNIELVGLHLIAEEVTREFYKQKRKRVLLDDNEYLTDIDPQREIPGRFMIKFYDMNTSDIDRLYKDPQTFEKFIKAKQEVLHLP